jgi:hypothetical protein
MSEYSKETEVVMSGFTGGAQSLPRKTLGQRGESMVSLFIWMFLAVAVMGGVVTMFVSSSKTTATSAQHTQQQGSILNALNRVSRDVTDSDPIIYASTTEMVVDVKGDNDPNASTVERRRYVYLPASNTIVWQKKDVPSGTPYNPANLTVEWPTSNKQSTIVKDMKPFVTGDTPVFQYFDKNSTAITALPATGAAAEAIARVDIKATANVLTKGNVSLSTSAVPRSRVIGDTPDAIAPTCPAFTAVLNPDSTITLRWAHVSGANSYTVSQNGVDLTPTITVVDPNQPGYQFVATPYTDPVTGNLLPVTTQVFNYLLKVTNASGTASCRSNIQTIIMETPPTQFNAVLLPTTVFNAPNDPKSTGWTAAGELTRVRMTWDAVLSGSGYQVFRQQKSATGVLIGTTRTLVYTTDDPSVTTYTHTIPVGDDGKNWEWSIKVLARTGDNDMSNRKTTLTYPTPVTQTKADASSFGTNTITWTGHDGGVGSLGYDVYRSAIDQMAEPAEATFTKIGSTPAAVQTFNDTNAALGSTYWYYVTAKNTSGFSNQFTAAKATQLQFPPDPVMKMAVVAGDGGSQDIADGSNRVNWNAAKSAAGYHVWRTKVQDSSTMCLTGTTCVEVDKTDVAGNGNNVPGTVAGSATSYTDSSSVVDPSTRFNYVAYAYNKTGLSPKLAAAVTLTQRPAPPVQNKTADPTLATTVTSLAWNQLSAGYWCNPTPAVAGNECNYTSIQYNNSGAESARGTVSGGTYSWNNQGWGRHYTYALTADNNAFYKGGVSEKSNTLSADTYPGDFGVDLYASDPWGNNGQRYMFTTTAINSNTTETTHTMGSQGAQYTAIGWGTSAGARKYDWARESACSGGTVCTGAASAAMPTSQWIGGSKAANENWSYDVAAPGTTYWSSVTATSLENNLTRPKNSPPKTTPADLPRQGYQQIVCNGPWDAPPGSIWTSDDAANYAKRTFTPQTYGSRLINFDQNPKYGLYSGTVMQGKYQTASHINNTYYWYDRNGVGYKVEPMKKGSESYYTGGFWHEYAAGGSSMSGVYDSNIVGQAPHRSRVGTGMKIFNKLWNNPALESYWIMTIVDEEATRAGCDKGSGFIEPRDACYEWDGNGTCSSLNQYNQDGRPRWFTY